MKTKRVPKIVLTKDLKLIYFGKIKATSLDLKKFVLPIIGACVAITILGLVGSSDYAIRYGL